QRLRAPSTRLPLVPPHLVDDMIAFLAGLSVVYGALLAWALAAQPVWLRVHDERTLWMALVLVVVPVCAAWAACGLVHLLAPRGLFERRLRRGGTRFALGLIAGLIGTALGAIVLALPGVDQTVADAVPLGAGAALATAAVLLPLSRRKAGHCIFCSYDL